MGLAALAGQPLMGNQALRSRGYALLLVLFSVAVLTSALAVLSARRDAERDNVRMLKAAFEERLSTRRDLVELLHAMALSLPGPAGWTNSRGGILRADGRFYRMPSGMLVSVQDERGLFSLPLADKRSIVSLLLGVGVELDQAQALTDTLIDYTDTDDLRSLNGAEAQDYRAAGLPAPRNDWLLGIDELAQVMGWHARPELRRQLAPWLTQAPTGALNPNTTPAGLVHALWSHAPPQGRALFLAQREQVPFMSAASMARVIGVPVNDDRFVFRVGERLRIVLRRPGSAWGYQYNVTFNPQGRHSPWLVSEARFSPLEPGPTPDELERVAPFSLDPSR